MPSPYSVSLIPQDMQHEDTVMQIADTLEYMGKIVDEIFSNIQIRVSENKQRIDAISERVTTAKRKVDTLAGSKKATVVFSCTKYPVPDRQMLYKSCFPLTTNIQPVRTRVKTQQSLKSNKLTNEQLTEKLQFYHVKLSDMVKPEVKHGGKIEEIPDTATSICDLLFFNSPKNPYYVQLDPLVLQKRAQAARTLQGADGWMTMEAAPLSITSRETLVRREDKNYFYSPNIGDVPTIDVPIDLPDLPGIADGLRYSIESGPGIAPSVITSPVLPDLPTVQEIEAQSVAPPPPTPTPTPTTTPTAPVHINKPQKCEPHPVATTPLLATPIIKPPPPPPPPPPPTVDKITSTESTASKTTRKSTQVNAAPAAESMRANLMEAIRNAGGIQKAKLKSAETVPEVKAKPSAGNLMDDLHAKLSLRRKGISGAKGADTAGDAMSRISAMIPPPPRGDNTDPATTDNDDDWDD